MELLILEVIDRKTSVMTVVLYGILLGVVVIGTFVDVIGETLTSQFGLLLFITMAGGAFFTGQYVLRNYVKKLHLDLIDSRFLNVLSRAAPFVLYADLAIIVCMIFQMLTIESYSVWLLIATTILTGSVGCLLFGFRFYKFLSWYKSNKSSMMVLAFTIETFLLTVGMSSTVIINTWSLSERPAAITPQFVVNLDPGTFLSPTQNLVNMYGYLVPIIVYVIPEMVGIALFLRYFIDRLGKARFWVIVTLPPLLLITSTFLPQVFTSGQNFAYLDSKFTSFRIIGTLGWVVGSFVMAFAYLSVARTIRQVSPNSAVINYLIVAAFAQILFPLTANNVIMESSYPSFGSILYSFFVLSAFLFSMGIYSAALSVSQDAKLRQLIRKHAKESTLLDTVGTAEMVITIQNRVNIIRNQADAMTKNSGVESSMTDSDIRRYLELAIVEAKKEQR